MPPIRLALRAAPGLTLRAFAARARGQRVRARRLLGEAASLHPGYYAWWAENHGPASIAAWCAVNPPGEGAPPDVAVIVLPGTAGDEADTRASVAAVLPKARPGAAGPTLGATVQDLAADWLLVLRPGDHPIPGLADVLAQLPADLPADLVYWDHVVEASGRPADPVVKPDWDPLLAASCELLGSAAVLRLAAVRALLDREPALAAEPLGLASCGRLQATLAGSAPPHHVPLILTRMASAGFWRPPAPDGSVAAVRSAGETWPGVSIVVPTRDQAGLMASCIAGLDRLAYPGRVELLVIDNGSIEPATHALFARLAQRKNTRILPVPGPFNFAAMMNLAAQEAREPFLCLLNNDVVPGDGVWLEAMMRHARQPGVGAVGARLFYPDGAVQHAGVAIGIGGAAGHVAKGARAGAGPFAMWHEATRRVSAVTGACLVVDRAKYLAVGGMDADAFAVDFNDVDLCLRLDRAGWDNRIVVEASLVHHESRSRGHRRTGAALARFEAELAELRRRWHTVTARDPWHSPLFSPESERCLLRC